MAFSIPLISLFYFAWVYFHEKMAKSIFIKVIAYLMLWCVIYALTPFLIGFTLYFVLHHSVNSMKHQYESLKNLSKHYNLKTYVKDISILTLVAYFGIAFLLLLSGVEAWEYLTLYALVFISVLTLPHMLVFDDFYSEREGRELS